MTPGPMMRCPPWRRCVWFERPAARSWWGGNHPRQSGEEPNRKTAQGEAPTRTKGGEGDRTQLAPSAFRRRVVRFSFRVEMLERGRSSGGSLARRTDGHAPLYRAGRPGDVLRPHLASGLTGSGVI